MPFITAGSTTSRANTQTSKKQKKNHTRVLGCRVSKSFKASQCRTFHSITSIAICPPRMLTFPQVSNIIPRCIPTEKNDISTCQTASIYGCIAFFDVCIAISYRKRLAYHPLAYRYIYKSHADTYNILCIMRMLHA